MERIVFSGNNSEYQEINQVFAVPTEYYVEETSKLRHIKLNPGWTFGILGGVHAYLTHIGNLACGSEIKGVIACDVNQFALDYGEYLFNIAIASKDPISFLKFTVPFDVSTIMDELQNGKIKYTGSNYEVDINLANVKSGLNMLSMSNIQSDLILEILLNNKSLIKCENGKIEISEYLQLFEDIKKSTNHWLHKDGGVFNKVKNILSTKPIKLLQSPIQSLKLSDIPELGDINCMYLSNILWFLSSESDRELVLDLTKTMRDSRSDTVIVLDELRNGHSIYEIDEFIRTKPR
jgi:hypothetical protein